ncbi:mRNA splicing protein prp18 [Gryganskiella cystojenkinii]|nr:mRNA splicing protein prp18 [Gryganskiella cystojenkinii]
MDLIEATLAKKRSALESANGSTKKKYIRRGDLEKQREQEYLAEQDRERKEKEEKEKLREQELAAKRQAAKEAAAAATKAASGSTADSSSPSTPTSEEGTKAGEVDIEGDGEDASGASWNIAPEEVARRLRARGHPIRLFAETDKARKVRLRALELVEDRSEGGQRNDFMRAMENAESGLQRDALGRQTEEKSKKTKEDSSKNIDTSEISVDLFQKDQDKLYVLIYTYFKRLLREWQQDLDERPDEIKRSTPGKLATATQAQSAEYLKPFFKSLRHKALEQDVLMRITEIAQLMIKREHMAANDAYLKLSIGNAPWPIGVTMVGIHERSGREKIFSAQVAHVLNDETSRKWIQSIKRIMTFAEKKYPRI